MNGKDNILTIYLVQKYENNQGLKTEVLFLVLVDVIVLNDLVNVKQYRLNKGPRLNSCWAVFVWRLHVFCMGFL